MFDSVKSVMISLFSGRRRLRGPLGLFFRIRTVFDNVDFVFTSGLLHHFFLGSSNLRDWEGNQAQRARLLFHNYVPGDSHSAHKQQQQQGCDGDADIEALSQGFLWLPWRDCFSVIIPGVI